MPDQDPFAQLPHDANPPAGLKRRVVADLRRRGLVRSAWMPRVLALAAGLALFAAGTWVGGRDGAPPSGPQFALLLYEPAGFDTTRSHEELAIEYRAWAGSLGTQFVAGEALGVQRVLGGTLGPVEPTGFFLIRAESWEEAMAVAETCPHLRYGGVVAVRAILT